MGDGSRRILLLYTDRYYLAKPIYPYGLDLLANELRQWGHEVSIHYPLLPDPDPETNLIPILREYRPHIIGMGIRNLDTCMSCERYGDYQAEGVQAFYFLPSVKRLVDAVKQHAPGVPVIAGGGAFSISPVAMLTYLGISYGVVGEGEESLRRFVEAYPEPEKIAGIPGLAQVNGKARVNSRQPYRFKAEPTPMERDRTFSFAFEHEGMPVQVKRGCDQQCSYCVEPLIEGREYTFRSLDHVIEELGFISDNHDQVSTIFFVDTEFNLPDLRFCSLLVNRIMEAGLQKRFRFVTQLLPKPFDAEFASALARANFSIIITCDSFADTVLKRNHMSYREADILATLKLCEDNGIPSTFSMIFGLPGETVDTLDHTLEQMNRHPPGPLRHYEYTIGGRVYQGTSLCGQVERGRREHLYGSLSPGYMEPLYYVSPDSPAALLQYIEGATGHSLVYGNCSDDTRFRSLALGYLADQGQWQTVVSRFCQSQLPVRSSIYSYVFQKLADSGQVEGAKAISHNLLQAIEAEKEPGPYQDQTSLIRFFLSRLT